MKVHLIKAKTVRKFAKDHAASINSLEKWIDIVKSADWDSPENMKQSFTIIDILGKGSNRAVFDVGEITIELFANINLAKPEFIYSFVGLIPTQNTLSFVRRACSIL